MLYFLLVAGLVITVPLATAILARYLLLVQAEADGRFQLQVADPQHAVAGTAEQTNLFGDVGTGLSSRIPALTGRRSGLSFICR